MNSIKVQRLLEDLQVIYRLEDKRRATLLLYSQKESIC